VTLAGGGTEVDAVVDTGGDVPEDPGVDPTASPVAAADVSGGDSAGAVPVAEHAQVVAATRMASIPAHQRRTDTTPDRRGPHDTANDSQYRSITLCS
jgi:hypothetical protein